MKTFTLKEIRPSIEYDCEAELSKETKRYKTWFGNREPRCPWRAMYEIDGKKLCTRHAEQYSLKLLFLIKENE